MFSSAVAAQTAVPGRIVTVVHLPLCDFIMLDSLKGDNDGNSRGPVEGELNEAEGEWLKANLPGWKRPVFLGAHHPVKELSVGSTPLMEFIGGCPNLAGWIHGHNHRWHREWNRDMRQKPPQIPKRELSLPSTGMWGDIGYAFCRLHPDKIIVEPVLKDYWIPRPVPKEKRPVAWDDMLIESRASGSCTIRF